MSEQSSMHSYLNWTKQRIDEMDATLASLEAKAGQVQADSKVKANQLIADLKKQRDEFQTNVKKQAVATEAAWKTNKAQIGLAVESIRSAGHNLHRHRRQAGPAATGSLPRRRCRSSEGLARSGRHHPGRGDKVRCGTAGRRRDRRDKDEGRCRRGGSAIAEVESDGKPVLGSAERGLGGITQGFRSGQSGRVGCSQASYSSVRPLKGIQPRSGLSPIVSMLKGGIHGHGCSRIA